ncbi:citrate (pro-3S)-lyase subunit beta [Gottschalkiaceae bacterium SANA]|nr:citrate (pro-3S)-lyase subunit beta [Gottschalkiaceae bacterium SANA]
MSNLRRTMLFCPASNPKLLFTAMIYKPDCILFDLEDSVAYKDKIASRDLLVEALKSVDYKGCEVFARINSLDGEFGEEDVRELVKAGLRKIRLPMCESKLDVRTLAELLDEVEEKNNIENGSVKIQCSLETPKGVHHSLSIATASKRVISISFGAEDFTRTLGVNRTKNGVELAYARGLIVLNASIAGVDAIDTVYADIADVEGFLAEVKNAKAIGFAGKSCVHPSQIPLVHDIYSPSEEEIEWAIKILKASQAANINEGGVILVEGKMVDIPVIEKAKRVLKLAQVTIENGGIDE